MLAATGTDILSKHRHLAATPLSFYRDNQRIVRDCLKTDSCRQLVLHRVQWSGRRESNPHNQLGRLKFYH